MPIKDTEVDAVPRSPRDDERLGSPVTKSDTRQVLSEKPITVENQPTQSMEINQGTQTSSTQNEELVQISANSKNLAISTTVGTAAGTFLTDNNTPITLDATPEPQQATAGTSSQCRSTSHRLTNPQPTQQDNARNDVEPGH